LAILANGGYSFNKKTFMVDKRIEKKLRYIQAQLIANDEDDENWSQSKIPNIMLLLVSA
jgi:hypothetical protein